MKTLEAVDPTAEQLVLVSNPQPGVQIIRGAAGSGKTTTALLMLRQLSAFWVRRLQRQGIPGKIRVLVITFNRTLRGYIEELVNVQVQHRESIDLTVATFAKWSTDILLPPKILGERDKLLKVKALSKGIPLADKFLEDEIDYLLGRFPPSRISEYLSCRRDGRGASPRVDRALRQKILEEVIHPYSEWKNGAGVSDWNDLTLQLQDDKMPAEYDIIVADEVQDFSANQVRAIMHYAANPSSVVFVLDAAQRIYPRGFTWAEVGVSPTRSHRLGINYRNTQEICRFASPLLEGLNVGDDGTFPDFNSCVRHGSLPTVIEGAYSQQVKFVVDQINSSIDLSSESIAFLKPRGGHWFDYLRQALRDHSLRFVDITRENDWPTGPVNIALCTMHSAKGLEFDHVFALGLNDEVTPYGEEPGDSTFENLRRLLAVAITRAKKTVVIGYKPEEASGLVSLFDPSTYRIEKL